jgi:hypothetical protein
LGVIGFANHHSTGAGAAGRTGSSYRSRKLTVEIGP